MGCTYFRYHKPSLDNLCAMQHDEYVSSIFLQENRFNPPLAGIFLPVFFPRAVGTSSVLISASARAVPDSAEKRLRAANAKPAVYRSLHVCC